MSTVKRSKAELYLVEPRDSAGALLTDGSNPPPFVTASRRQLFEYYWDQTNDLHGSWSEVEHWFRHKGWHIRKREW